MSPDTHVNFLRTDLAVPPEEPTKESGAAWVSWAKDLDHEGHTFLILHGERGEELLRKCLLSDRVGVHLSICIPTGTATS